MVQHIFLSYCHEDYELMQRIRDDFSAAELVVWTDKGIELGTPSWKWEVEKRIRETCCLVAILSPDAAQSRWVREELDFAEFQGKPIFIVLGRGEEREAIIFGFVAAQRIDIRDEIQYKIEVNRLISAITKRCDDSQKISETPVVAHAYAPPPVIHPLLSELGETVLPPPFVWCEIPAGPVVLEDVSQRYPAGTKGGRFFVNNFAVGKYPITNAQYQVFVEAVDGYGQRRWWDYSAEGTQWRSVHSIPQRTAFPGDDLPRTNVNWYDAMAFCRWLGQKLGQTVELPTEMQWQRAAQGDLGLTYPWGDDFDPALCNTNDRIGRPTSVTEYLYGASPYGVMDMSGNVWNWCLTNWITGDAVSKGNAPRVVRGGAWYTGNERALLTWRDAQSPDYVHPGFGFRVCTGF